MFVLINYIDIITQRMNKKTHQQVSQALDCIITKCGQTLYQTYLIEKLPNDCNQRMSTKIQSPFDTMYTQKPIKPNLRRQFMPVPASIDLNANNKIVVRSKSHSQVTHKNQDRFFNTEVAVSMNNKDNQIKRQSKKDNFISKMPNFSFKYSCQKIQLDPKQDQLRRAKRQSEKPKVQPPKQYASTISDSRRRALQSKIKQLINQGIPYAYDDQGNLIIPDIKQYKKQIQIQSKKKVVPKPFSLRFKAIQLLSQQSQVRDSQKIQGRKRGYSSTKTQRKRKINDQQFTNKHERQNSSIPFMTIADGIKIVEKDRNIMAQKIRQPQITRQQYQNQSRKTFFRSFLPTSQCSTFRVSTAERPATHALSRRSLGVSSAISLSTRPKTSKQFNRININNKELAIQLVKQDTFLGRRFI